MFLSSLKFLHTHSWHSLSATLVASIAIATLTSAADVTGLKSTKLEEREAAANAIRKDRQELISELMKLAAEQVTAPGDSPAGGDYPWHDAKHLAILLLGEFRAAEGVPILLENIEYENPRIRGAVSEPISNSGFWFPAADSLVKIGTPSVEQVIAKLGSFEKDGVSRRNCLWVLRHILGEKLGRVKLELAIQESRNASHRANLEAALLQSKS